MKRALPLICLLLAGCFDGSAPTSPPTAAPVVTPSPAAILRPPASTATPEPPTPTPAPSASPAPSATAIPTPSAPPTLLAATPAPPFDPRTLRAPNSLRAPEILGDAAIPSPTPTDVTSNLGQFGTSWLDNTELGVYVNSTAYAQGEVQLPYDAGYLYAPTTHASGGNCLEVPTKYRRWYDDKATFASLVVYNFCAPGGPAWASVEIPLDDAFLRDYVRDFGHGPQYTMEQFQRAPHIWAAYLYNYSTQAWREIFEASNDGVTIGGWGWGWTLFEPHLRPSPSCPPMPPVSISDLTVFDAKLGWQLVTQGYVDKAAGNYFQSGASAFGPCETGASAVYHFALTSPFSAWSVSP